MTVHESNVTVRESRLGQPEPQHLEPRWQHVFSASPTERAALNVSGGRTRLKTARSERLPPPPFPPPWGWVLGRGGPSLLIPRLVWNFTGEWKTRGKGVLVDGGRLRVQFWEAG